MMGWHLVQRRTFPADDLARWVTRLRASVKAISDQVAPVAGAGVHRTGDEANAHRERTAVASRHHRDTVLAIYDDGGRQRTDDGHASVERVTATATGDG